LAASGAGLASLASLAACSSGAPGGAASRPAT